MRKNIHYKFNFSDVFIHFFQKGKNECKHANEKVHSILKEKNVWNFLVQSSLLIAIKHPKIWFWNNISKNEQKVNWWKKKNVRYLSNDTFIHRTLHEVYFTLSAASIIEAKKRRRGLMTGKGEAFPSLSGSPSLTFLRVSTDPVTTPSSSLFGDSNRTIRSYDKRL